MNSFPGYRKIQKCEESNKDRLLKNTYLKIFGWPTRMGLHTHRFTHYVLFGDLKDIFVLSQLGV